MAIDVSTAVGSTPVVRRGLFRLLLRNPMAVAGMVVLSVLGVVALIQPWIMPFPPQEINLRLANALPFTSEYLLGGDKFGRDILSRLIAGTRSAVIASVTLTSVALLLGVVMGLLAGYFGRTVDSIGTWIFAVLIAAPTIVVLIGLYTLIDVSLPVAMATLGVMSAPGVFYLVRALTISVRKELYVDAARVSGLSSVRIMGRHVLLAVKGPIIILAAFLAGAAIAIAAGLEFLGLGDPREPSWGSLLSDAFTNYYIAPWQLIWPGLALGIVMAAFVLVGNAARDALEGAGANGGSTTRPPRRDVADRASLPEPASPGESLGSAAPDQPLLSVRDLQVAYPTDAQSSIVVDGVGFTVAPGEVVGLVGESGSGKTQTVFAVLGLLPDQAEILSGSVRLEGQELLGQTESVVKKFRGRVMAYVPQEPMSNLDPSFTVGSQLVEGIRAQSALSHREAKAVALAMLDRVGIHDPERTFRSYRHEISGGMAQRVLIAGAIACKPRLLVADEPTTALDVTVQAEILDLLLDLQQDFGMGMLIVTHNLGVVADICTRVIVMRQGRMVEEGSVREVFAHPKHEYTRMLLDSVLDDRAARPALKSPKESRHA